MVNKKQKCPECEYALQAIREAGISDTLEGFERRANREFTNRGLTQHYNAKHRNPSQTKCIKCGKSLSWEEETFCAECQKEIDADMEASNAEYAEKLSEEDQETEDEHQAVDDAYNARFKDSRGRSVFNR